MNILFLISSFTTLELDELIIEVKDCRGLAIIRINKSKSFPDYLTRISVIIFNYYKFYSIDYEDDLFNIINIG